MTKNIAIIKVVPSPSRFFKNKHMLSLIDNNRVEYGITLDETNKVSNHSDSVLEGFIYNNKLTKVTVDNLKDFLNDVAKFADELSQADVIIKNNKALSIDNVNFA